jgi:hypothetical protein
MTYPFHSLLPINLQAELRAAKPSNLDHTIKSVQENNPRFFHNKDTLDSRVFFNEPRGKIEGGTFIHAAPARIYEEKK